MKEKKMRQKFVGLWISFLLFFLCCLAVEIQLGVLLSIWTTGLSIYLLIKNKLPSLKNILLSILLAALVSVSFIGMGAGIGTVAANGLLSGVPTLLCSMAVFSVAEKREGLRFSAPGTGQVPFASILIGIGTGTVLSIINVFLMIGNTQMDFCVSFSRLLVCLNPAIYEEIACRAIFLAFFLYKLGGQEATRFQSFTMWFMMCVPHTVAHGYDLLSTILLCILFGLPFAILQKKRDVLSAMISHGLVDAVRFTIFGLGF